MRGEEKYKSEFISSAKSRIIQARSLPSRKPFYTAVVISMLHYLGIIITLAAIVYLVIDSSKAAGQFIVGGVVFSSLTWFVSYFKRRAVCCPLCKGTPLINSGALAHSTSKRFPPFNHGVSATLSIIACQRFRCMYCGSDFDLLKTPSHRLVRGKNDEVVS